MRIRKYDTNGLGYLRAEVEWDSSDVFPVSDFQSFAIPGSGFAELRVTQEEYFVTISIVPDNFPHQDHLQLPVLPGRELPIKVIGCSFPSCFYDLPYIVSPLDDTVLGFSLSVGVVS